MGCELMITAKAMFSWTACTPINNHEVRDHRVTPTSAATVTMNNIEAQSNHDRGVEIDNCFYSGNPLLCTTTAGAVTLSNLNYNPTTPTGT